MYIFYLHIHVKIQCRFPLDRRVRMDSQVQFVRRTEMHTGLGFPPRHYPNTLVYMKWFRKHFCTVLFFPLCTAEVFSDVFLYSNHRSKILCQTLMKKPKRLRLDSLVLSKEGLPVPQSCGQAWLSSGKGCPHHPARRADAHSTQAEEGWLPHPQKSEPHLDSCPKIHELHHRAESCPVKIHIALTGYRVDCYLIHW